MGNAFVFINVVMPDGSHNFVGPFSKQETVLLQEKFHIDPVAAAQPLREMVVKVVGTNPINSFFRFMWMKKEEREVAFKVMGYAQNLVAKH